MSSNLTPQEPFALKQTNVSNPSIIHSKHSQQSITASEDYYSLAGSSASSTHSAHHVHDNSQSQHTITQFETPPSRYRTPQQSSTNLPRHSGDRLSLQSREQTSSQRTQAQSQLARSSLSREGINTEQHVAFAEGADTEQGRKTPMRGEGRRRSSLIENPTVPLIGAGAPTFMPPHEQSRDGLPRAQSLHGSHAQRESYARSSRGVPLSVARSSVAQEIDRDASSSTPGVDDTDYIVFALDQLTRDEEVRGSRTYGALQPSMPYPAPSDPHGQSQTRRQAHTDQWPREQRVRGEDEIAEAIPPRSPRRPIAPALPPPPNDFKEGPNVFVPLSHVNARQPALNFLPGILRLPALIAFLTLLLAYIICLIFAASWSRADTGLWDYDVFGDARYFVFQFLPTMLGMVLLLWLFQIEVAVYRVVPFIAMSLPSAHIRNMGGRLPLQPPGFVLPYLGHFRAQQPAVGSFFFISWLQVFTLPLLGSSFNVYYLGPPSAGQWRWIATQGVIWVVIALYILLFVALVILRFWLGRCSTGLKWDPRSLADMVVLLERSNALEYQDPIGQLGYWRTTNRPNEVLHTFGIADKPARSYTMEDGQIREKPADPAPRRYSDPDADIEAGEPRASKDAILPGSDEDFSQDEHRNGPLPWFLWPSFALLWPIIAVVLLLAFLIVSYLPSTRISAGFLPDVPAPVNTMGFSSTNFLYSFVPGFLGTLCFLFWLDIDYAYRRLQPLASLASTTGSLAEHTLLTTYPSDKPVFVTLAAIANGHYRLAFLTIVTLIASALPILAGGVFWAQFEIATQRTIITAEMTAFYAMTVLVTLYALAYLAIFPPGTLRSLPPNVGLGSFHDLRVLLTQSRLLNDVAFRAPASRTDLVTRLLSPFPGIYLSSAAAQQQQPHGDPRAGSASALNASKLSLADSVRGFGRARPPPLAKEMGAWNALPRYAFGRHTGRDGREFVGVDRVRT